MDILNSISDFDQAHPMMFLGIFFICLLSVVIFAIALRDRKQLKEILQGLGALLLLGVFVALLGWAGHASGIPTPDNVGVPGPFGIVIGFLHGKHFILAILALVGVAYYFALKLREK